MSTTLKFLLILNALLFSNFITAQDSNKIAYSKFPLKIALGNHAVGFPYQNAFVSFNPIFSVGTERGINKNQKHHLFVSSNLGFIRNKVIGNTLTIDLGLGYRYTHRVGPFIEASISLGVLDQFHPRDIYTLNSTDHSYEKSTDTGKLASLVGFKTGIGYDFSKRSKLPIRIGLSHIFFIQSPYFDLKNFPIMPQSTTTISVTYKFKKV